ncbi:hypothetical protein Tco_0971472 [Tanacetum coccineum]
MIKAFLAAHAPFDLVRTNLQSLDLSFEPLDYFTLSHGLPSWQSFDVTLFLLCTNGYVYFTPNRAAAPSTYILASRSETLPSGTPPLLSIPLPTSSPPLLLPSTNCRVDVPEVTLPPRKRFCIAPGPRYEIGESSSAPTTRVTGGFRADYGFVGTLDVEIRRDPDREIGYNITDVWVDLDEIAEEIPYCSLFIFLNKIK